MTISLAIIKSNAAAHNKIQLLGTTTTIYKDKVVFTTEAEAGHIAFGDKKIRVFRVPGMKNQDGNQAWFYLRTEVAYMIGMENNNVTVSLRKVTHGGASSQYDDNHNTASRPNDENATVQTSNTQPRFTVKFKSGAQFQHCDLLDDTQFMHMVLQGRSPACISFRTWVIGVVDTVAKTGSYKEPQSSLLSPVESIVIANLDDDDDKDAIACLLNKRAKREAKLTAELELAAKVTRLDPSVPSIPVHLDSSGVKVTTTTTDYHQTEILDMKCHSENHRPMIIAINQRLRKKAIALGKCAYDQHGYATVSRSVMAELLRDACKKAHDEVKSGFKTRSVILRGKAIVQITHFSHMALENIKNKI